MKTDENQMPTLCSNCKNSQENVKNALLALNFILNEMGSLVERDNMWRNGKILNLND